MMKENSSIRVLIVTNARFWSDTLRVTCASQPDMLVVGSVTDKAQALALRDRCDVMLVSHDIQDAVGLIQASSPERTPVVVMVGLPNVESLIVRYMEAGAAACIREHDSTEELIQAIRTATHRPMLETPAPVRLDHIGPARPAERNLTRREREILELIAQGYGNREIAKQLTIELGTTKNHVHNILDKLNVKTRKDAAVYYSLGLV